MIKPKYQFVILINSCFGYFAIGAICWWLDWMSKDAYLTGAGIVGSLASVLGLVALIRPAITRTDIQNLEIESLREISEHSRKLEQLESARNLAQKQIGDLELRKREMEFLVRKASLSLYLQEQRKLHERRVREEIDRNRDLNCSLSELRSIDARLSALNSEIDKDPNVEQLREIIRVASHRKPTFEEYTEHLPVPMKALYLFIHGLSEILTKSLSITIGK